MDQLSELTDLVVQFRDERDWARFHTPSHLASALSIESAEVQELFLWMSEDEISAWIEDKGHAALKAELADVLIFLLLLSHEFDISLGKAVREKLEENAKKYPVELARGNARKYTELGDDIEEDEAS